MNLSHEQLENIGYAHLRAELRCASPYGREALRELRPFAPGQEEALVREWDNIEKTLRCLVDFRKEYARLESILMQLKDIRASISRCGAGVLSDVELFEIKRFLLQLAGIAPLFAAVDAAAAYHGIAFDALPKALELMDPEGTRVASFHVSARYSPELAGLRRQKKALEEEAARAGDGAQSEELLLRRRLLAGAEQAEEEKVRAALSQKLGPYREAMLQNTRAAARLDLTLQKAKLASARGGARPALAAGGIRFRGMQNPLVADTLKAEGKPFVPADITLLPGAAVITGANMGGKSVALKTLALNVYISQCGFYALAAEAVFPMLEGLYLVNDDLEDTKRGLSSFGGELVRFGEIAAALDKSPRAAPALVLLDEFARGTNPREGAAIAQSVCEYLNGHSDFSVMTTHFDHVADYAKTHYEVAGLKGAAIRRLAEKLRGAPLKERMELIAREMDYGLVPAQKGAEAPRDAVNICRLLGMPQTLLEQIEAKLL